MRPFLFVALVLGSSCTLDFSKFQVPDARGDAGADGAPTDILIPDGDTGPDAPAGVVCEGELRDCDRDGVCEEVAGGQCDYDFVMVDGGESFTCGLRKDGKVHCWGRNNQRQLNRTAGSVGAVPREPVESDGGEPIVASQLAVSAETACVVGIGAAVIRCWGGNGRGEIPGTVGDSRNPRTVQLPDTVRTPLTQLVAGKHHFCVIDDLSKIYCWGDNRGGQVSPRSATPTLAEPVLAIGPDVTAVAAGHRHTCAVAANGEILCWGSNSDGQFNEEAGPAPVSVIDPDKERVVGAITAGAEHTCAVLDGDVQCWGGNTAGQLGNATSMPTRTIVSPPLTGDVTSIVAGAFSTCALADGKVWCWGDDTNRALGTGATEPNPLRPTEAQTGRSDGLALGSGARHACAVYPKGELMCWGANVQGELGTGRTMAQPMPTAIADLTATSVTVGAQHACAAVGPTLWCWGSNDRRMLGTAAGRATSTPGEMAFGNLREPARISAGTAHTCIIREDSRVFCFGANGNGQLGTEAAVFQYQDTEPDVSFVSAGVFQRCLTTSDEVSCFGTINGGIMAQGYPSLRGAAAIVTGLDHACAIVAGAVHCWGNSADGRLGIGADVDRWEPPQAVGGVSGMEFIAAGAVHTCASGSAAGTLWCWGRNGDGQVRPDPRASFDSPTQLGAGPLGSLGILGLAAGSRHTCAIVDGGKVFCWGANDMGQLGIGMLTTDDQPPTEVVGLDRITEISAGASSADSTCALAADGRVFCWGASDFGVLGTGETLYESTPTDVPYSVDL